MFLEQQFYNFENKQREQKFIQDEENRNVHDVPVNSNDESQSIDDRNAEHENSNVDAREVDDCNRVGENSYEERFMNEVRQLEGGSIRRAPQRFGEEC